MDLAYKLSREKIQLMSTQCYAGMRLETKSKQLTSFVFSGISPRYTLYILLMMAGLFQSIKLWEVSTQMVKIIFGPISMI